MSKGIAYGDPSTPFIFGRKNMNYQGKNSIVASRNDSNDRLNATRADNDFSHKKYSENIPSTIDECNDILDNADDSSSPDYDIIRTQLAILQAQGRDVPIEDADVSTILSDINTPDGGSTYNPLTNTSPVGGFCYSPYPELSKAIAPGEKITAENIVDYAEECMSMLSKDNHFVGVWNDPKDGTVYLDISVAIMDADEARYQCEEEDQIAFFDLQRYESVIVDENATSGQG